MRSAKKEGVQARFRRFRSLSRTVRDSSRKARMHKLPCPGAMAMADREENLPNGVRATLKSLLDCFKLHLPIPLVSITLLTRGYFEILFEEEEGAKATRRLMAIEWSGLCLSFSRYALNFDASSQGAEAQLTHAIKVQFPDLHDEFRNTRALTIMASKLGKVLEIEAVDSYIKRPAGPMITIELRDISKLSRYIRIPSMVEGTENNVTRILYSGLPNQCRRCRRFDHHTRACTTSRSKPWEGAPTPNPPNTGEKKERGQEE
ncbi:unnamed protein product [Sphagnum balticum]